MSKRAKSVKFARSVTVLFMCSLLYTNDYRIRVLGLTR